MLRARVVLHEAEDRTQGHEKPCCPHSECRFVFHFSSTLFRLAKTREHSRRRSHLRRAKFNRTLSPLSLQTQTPSALASWGFQSAYSTKLPIYRTPWLHRIPGPSSKVGHPAAMYENMWSKSVWVPFWTLQLVSAGIHLALSAVALGVWKASSDDYEYGLSSTYSNYADRIDSAV